MEGGNFVQIKAKVTVSKGSDEKMEQITSHKQHSMVPENCESINE